MVTSYILFHIKSVFFKYYKYSDLHRKIQIFNTDRNIGAVLIILAGLQLISEPKPTLLMSFITLRMSCCVHYLTTHTEFDLKGFSALYLVSPNSH